jgi:hypothetical protein
MSNAIITNETLKDIADAIRAKGGASGSMLPREMPGNIRNIDGSGGGGMGYQQKTVQPSLETVTVHPDQGYDALSAVTVEPMNVQSKTVTPGDTQQTILPDEDYDALSSVKVEAARYMGFYINEVGHLIFARSVDLTNMDFSLVNHKDLQVDISDDN